MAPMFKTALKSAKKSAAATTPKRGPGRPRKNPVETDEIEEQPVKRGPGRPRKNPLPVETVDETPKRKPGRPKKVVETDEETETATATSSGPDSGTIGSTVYVSIDQIKLHKGIKNTREEVEPESFAENVEKLKKSIKSQGLLTSLPVASFNGKLYAAGGFSRLAALKGLAEENVNTFKRLFKSGVPCKIVSDSEVDARMKVLVENYTRTEPSQVTTMQTIVQLRDDGIAPKDIASAIGAAPSQVSKYLSANDGASKAAMEAFTKDEISFDTLYSLSKLDADEQDAKILGVEEEEEGDDESVVVEDKRKKLAKAAKGDKPAKLTKSEIVEIRDRMVVSAVDIANSTTKGGKTIFGPEHIRATVACALSFSLGEMTLEELHSGIQKPKAFLKSILDEQGAEDDSE